MREEKKYLAKWQITATGFILLKQIHRKNKELGGKSKHRLYDNISLVDSFMFLQVFIISLPGQNYIHTI